MSEFEEISCKVLGVILFLLIVSLSLQLIGCACPAPQLPPSDYIDEVKMENFA
jgi:hypothetical protein